MEQLSPDIHSICPYLYLEELEKDGSLGEHLQLDDELSAANDGELGYWYVIIITILWIIGFNSTGWYKVLRGV